MSFNDQQKKTKSSHKGNKTQFESKNTKSKNKKLQQKYLRWKSLKNRGYVGRQPFLVVAQNRHKMSSFVLIKCHIESSHTPLMT